MQATVRYRKSIEPSPVSIPPSIAGVIPSGARLALITPAAPPAELGLKAEAGTVTPPEMVAVSLGADAYTMGASGRPESMASSANGWWVPSCRRTVAPAASGAIDSFGKAFGKQRLLVSTRQKFNRLLDGYRFPYEVTK